VPTRKQIAEAIDARMKIALPRFAAKQAKYLSKHGRYSQMLTGKRVPVDDTTGDTSVFDEFAVEIESKLPDGIAVEISVNVYETPYRQHGFELTMLLTDGEDRWLRTWNVGPETRRDIAWLKITNTVLA
jgi:hypothetical protein